MMVMIVIEKIIQFLKHVQILNVYCEKKKKIPQFQRIFSLYPFSPGTEDSVYL